MSVHYELNCGQYVLFVNGRPVSSILDEVAICLDKASGTRHKHGDPDMVNAWCKKTQDAFRSNGLDEMANDLVVIQGRFTLEDLNKVVDNTTYAATLYQKVIDGTAETLDLMGNVVRPALASA
ncbi:hypothetical protein WL29_22110 [Burkholderia ubonensis]|uniref:Uncharacterized protein n=1 Tax=Burkholderia ubonensis TaxID=101571 RepID=A0A106QD34_9BURK|nr:hypothetical protein [Burkholderia ubonensis]KWA84063.1 hypothetical protein WL29_22110 [Burkholderia ubonensis]